ncbi:GNAT family N-acetyltransferase [Pseudobutyrivibrio xylanivorans]|uniref:GNAT family N-acetyltransferase n=1 Tax=Pseudobutyrivibrio xylanivorans TaxID=185007 RepID=A0A5P6VN96_PSEXY|nr:GNAT family N-acetyltransferase [Pseudobutyrivibrio xylanivorans]QFJ53828.1 GNAT family N-acetyltransferase [Pseudobutyrivibrio xylanivorans]
MLLPELITERTNYAHVIAIINNSYETLYDEEDFFIIHSLVNDNYCVEMRDNSKLDKVAHILETLRPDLLLTTSQAIFNSLKNEYSNAYMCKQFTYPDNFGFNPNVRLLNKADLPYVIDTYGESNYITQLFDRNRILGYYLDNALIGYVVHHIDDTVGALFITPEYRRNKYGAELLKSAVNYFGSNLVYSHVVSTNTASLKLHQSIGAKTADTNIYWMHNIGYSFN